MYTLIKDCPGNKYFYCFIFCINIRSTEEQIGLNKHIDEISRDPPFKQESWPIHNDPIKTSEWALTIKINFNLGIAYF